MKRAVIILAVALVSVSCSLKKKSVEASVAKVDSVAVNATAQAKVERYTDTTVTTAGRVVVTEIDFSVDGTAGTIESVVFGVNGVEVSGITGRPIRSIKQHAFESAQERKGESQEREEREESKQVASVQREVSKLSKEVAPAPDPYRWRYIFYFSLVALSGALYIKRAPIVDWLRKMLRGLVKL